MSEHQKHTEFLRECLLYDDSAGHQELDKGIIQIQRDARCVWRAVWLMAMLTALSVAGLGYGAVLVDGFPYNTQPFVIDIICALGMGSLICLVVLVSLGMIYRMRLDQRREECRQLVTRLLESRLGKPATTPLKGMRANRFDEKDGRTILAANEAIDSPVKMESAAQG
jgi:hypothetical protein